MGKDPPLYYRRSEHESKAALSLKEARETAALTKKTELKDFEDFTLALLKIKQKKGMESWSGTPHESRIQALKEFAIGSGPQLNIRNLAVESLRTLNMGLTPNSAAVLMEELGILPPYAPLPLLRAGLTDTFTHELEEKARVGLYCYLMHNQLFNCITSLLSLSFWCYDIRSSIVRGSALII